LITTAAAARPALFNLLAQDVEELIGLNREMIIQMAGTPSMNMVKQGPCDSPAVK
jgi:hypothetical protein